MRLTRPRQTDRGFSFMLVMVFLGVALLMLTGVLYWSASDSTITVEHAEYYRAVAAAEAATEKVFVQLDHDFQSWGRDAVGDNTESYRLLVPTSLEDSAWDDYEFTSPAGVLNRLYVEPVTDWQFTNLAWKYYGMQGHAATYRVVANAQSRATLYHPIAGVRQDVQLAEIPVFSFAVFYGPDLEICPYYDDFRFNGPVHCNNHIYLEPHRRNLVFADHLTASRTIRHESHPADPITRTLGNIICLRESDWYANTLRLPLPTTDWSALIDIPPGGEATNSMMGAERLFNKADLIVMADDADLHIVAGAGRDFVDLLAAPHPVGQLETLPAEWQFIHTNKFWDYREWKTVQALELNVAVLANRYALIEANHGLQPRVIYVADRRTPTADTMRGVRLVQASVLPRALTLVTPNPLYVKGSFNAPDGPTTNTVNTLPAALIADALTIQSTNWNDLTYNESTALVSRPASQTIINAGVIAGIKPTGAGHYSGGLESLLRLEENWTAVPLYFNGSFVVLYPSRVASGYWREPGSLGEYYSIPRQIYTFDLNFKSPAKLPLATPQVRTVIRAGYKLTRAGAIE